MKKKFPLRVVLTVVTGRLLTEPKGERDNGISDLYEILNHMTGDSLFTHQLPRGIRECRPWLLRWHPELGNAEEHLGEMDAAIESAGEPAKAIDAWLAKCESEWGMRAEYEIGPIPQDDHEKINAYDELVQMRGTD